MLIYVLFHSPGVYGEQPIVKVLSGSTDVYDVGERQIQSCCDVPSTTPSLTKACMTMCKWSSHCTLSMVHQEETS